MVGRTISHYKITEKLGEGGMGVVYKAEDTKLKRPVALKFLSPHLLSDTEAKARFIREAQAAAALNHPNICTVHEIDEAGGRTFIVMAFLEGASLDTKIEAGPLKLNEALDFAIQTVQGLQAAHGKKIVHRDIKPANLMVTPQGAKQLVTIMDFGLAQLADRSKLTQGPTALGTVSYMSPEQAQGMELDHRTDLWALGAVIYEMVTGQRAFQGHYDQAITYSIQHEEPEPMTALRTGVPMELELLTDKCLVKDRERRYQHTDELLLDLETLKKKMESGRSTILRTSLAASAGAPHSAPGPAESIAGTRAQQTVPPQEPGGASEHPLAKYRVIENLEEAEDSVLYRAEDTHLKRLVDVRVVPQSTAHKIERRQRLLKTALVAVATLSALIAVVTTFLWLRQPEPQAPLRKLTLEQGEGLSEPVISPDGRHVAYLRGPEGLRELWIRDLDQEEPRQVVPAGALGSPFWSPDSQFIGFRSARELKKVSLQGGPAVTLCRVPSVSMSAATWSPDGASIVFGGIGPWQLFEVPAQGGEPELLFEPEEGGTFYVDPHFLPFPNGGRKLLYAAAKSRTNSQIIVQDLETGQGEPLASGFQPLFAGSGHIVYQRADPDGVWAVPFSIETLQATGEPFPIRENASDPSVARDGTLVYLGRSGSTLQQLVWRDRTGNNLGAIGQPQPRIRAPALSPDGSRVAVLGMENSNWDIWVHDIVRGLKTRVTSDPATEDRPNWLPAGDKISFSSNRNGNQDIFIKSADGRGEADVLVATPSIEFPYDWTHDGTYLIFDQWHEGRGMDLYYLRPKKDGSGYESVPISETQFDELSPKISPDGRFVAYESNTSGSYEVYVQPFPEGPGRTQVSSKGGRQPRWSQDGKEVFFVEGDALMAVPVSTTPTFSAGTATQLFEGRGAFADRGHTYDVSADGKQFVVIEPVGEATPSAIRVVQNWFAEFKERQQD